MAAFLDITVLLVAVLSFTAVICVGGAYITYTAGRKRALEGRLHSIQGAGAMHAADEGDSFLDSLSRLGAMLGSGSSSSKLYTRMVRAGFQSRNAVAVFMASRFLLFVGSLLILIPVVAMLDFDFTIRMAIALVGAGVVFFVPVLYIDYRAGKRAQEVRAHLPDMVDLLEVCVSGGMGLDQAWNAVAVEIRQVSELLADEMALTNLEMQLGEDRGVAMRHMADRTGADDLSAMVSALVQSQRFGTSVSQALRVFAENMRELRSSRAEEKAETMSVKMLFPMVVFIFPVVLIVAVGPAALTLMDTFATM